LEDSKLNRLLLSSALLAAAACGLPAGAGADEIVLKKEFGGEKIKCEIYKESDDYIHYIDVKKKMDCGCSKEIIAKITRVEKPLIDVEAFFVKKAKNSKDKRAREKAEKLAAELRKKRLAEEAKNKKNKKKVDKTEGERIGKCLVKPTTEKTGIKVLRTSDTGSNELLVDPFPEEDAKPEKKATKPRKKSTAR